MKKHPKYSIIAPVFNEKDCVETFHKRITKVMNRTRETWELILVDDGSTDGSTEMIRTLAKFDPHVRPVIFARNFGHQIAATAGLDYSQGEAVVIIDADLQDPPEVMLEMIKKWKEGYQVVYAVRSEREGETWFKKFAASLFYRLIFKITEVKIPLDTGDFRLLDRKVVSVMNSMREHQRFLRGMSAWVGFKQIGIPYRREARFAGKTKYPFKKMLKLALNAVTGFSFVPLQLAFTMGFISLLVAFFGLIIVIVLLSLQVSTYLGGIILLTVMFFFGGVQLVSLGILGEYIGRIYDEVKHRPLYIVAEAPAVNK
jgi:glycosyltransferase involved in cell wall biosynthesis